MEFWGSNRPDGPRVVELWAPDAMGRPALVAAAGNRRAPATRRTQLLRALLQQRAQPEVPHQVTVYCSWVVIWMFTGRVWWQNCIELCPNGCFNGIRSLCVASPEARSADGWDALMWSAQLGNCEDCRILLEVHLRCWKGQGRDGQRSNWEGSCWRIFVQVQKDASRAQRAC